MIFLLDAVGRVVMKRQETKQLRLSLFLNTLTGQVLVKSHKGMLVVTIFMDQICSTKTQLRFKFMLRKFKVVCCIFIKETPDLI